MTYKLIYCVLAVSFLCSLVHSQWTTIGNGVEYRQTNLPTGLESNNVLITYAGYLVDVTTVWTDRLLNKSILSDSVYGVKHAYSVKGPRTTNYAGLEIQNSKLISHLYSLVQNRNKPRLIVVIAHSSGVYVADEFFSQLFNKIYSLPNDPVYSALKKRIVFYNLDGDVIPSRKDSFYIQTLFSRVSFVWASKNGLYSMNSGSMRAGPSYYPTGLGVKSVQIECPLADCRNNRCLHDAVIIQAPWDPYNFDTYRDYTLFSVNGREVQSAYITSTDLLATINS